MKLKRNQKPEADNGTFLPQVKLSKGLQKIRNSMSQQFKMTILTVIGFAVVLATVGAFVAGQFQEVLYSGARQELQAAFNVNNFGGHADAAPTIDYTPAIKEKVSIPHANRFYIRAVNGRWFMFYRQGTELAYVDVTVEYKTVELYQTRLIWIFSLATIALLLMALALSRANMRPVLRSWQQQRTFVADAAHEFKTPMTVIQNNMERMLERPNDTIMDQVESVANTLTEVRHLNQLVGDLLTLAQADADIKLFAFAEFDLTKTMMEIGDVFQFSAEEHDQTLEVKVPTSLMMIGDAQRIRQLLVILTDNAQKYAGAGATVELVAEQTGNNSIKIEVRDTGKGVSDQDKQHLFDRFYRVDKARSRSTGGHGLGLSIAKWVVKGHRGTIAIKDNQPHGTIFSIVLPRSQKV